MSPQGYLHFSESDSNPHGIWVKKTVGLSQLWAQPETRRIMSHTALMLLWQEGSRNVPLGISMCVVVVVSPVLSELSQIQRIQLSSSWDLCTENCEIESAMGTGRNHKAPVPNFSFIHLSKWLHEGCSRDVSRCFLPCALRIVRTSECPGPTLIGSGYRKLWDHISSGSRWRPEGTCFSLLLGSCVQNASAWFLLCQECEQLWRSPLCSQDGMYL